MNTTPVSPNTSVNSSAAPAATLAPENGVSTADLNNPILRLHTIDSALPGLEKEVNRLLAERDALLNERANIQKQAAFQRVANLPEELGVKSPQEVIELIAAQAGMKAPTLLVMEEKETKSPPARHRGKGYRLDRETRRKLKEVLQAKVRARDLKVPEVAEQFGVSAQTVYSYMDRWHISKRRYHKRELAAA